MGRFNRILILGGARTGKDTVAKNLRNHYGYTFGSSSEAALDIFLFDALKENGLHYKSKEEAFEDRVNYRTLWRDLILDFNKDDLTKLSRAILAKNNIYVGMRSNAEYQACLKEGLFDTIIWVSRPGVKNDPSMDIEYDPTRHIKIVNDGDLLNLTLKTMRVAEAELGCPIKPRVAYDIDEVFASFISHVFFKFKVKDKTTPVTHWNDSRLTEHWPSIMDNVGFFSRIPAKGFSPRRLNNFPVAFVTARSFNKKVTYEWLERNFGITEVHVEHEHVKENYLNKVHIDYFLDDSPMNFANINSKCKDTTCFLLRTTYNTYIEGPLVVNSLQEFDEIITHLWKNR